MATTRGHSPILVIRSDGNGYCRTCGLPVAGTDHRNIWHVRTQPRKESEAQRRTAATLDFMARVDAIMAAKGVGGSDD